jgi:putative GTP pyrophosphokinase
MHNQSTFLLPENLDRSKLKAVYEELYPVYDNILQSIYQQVRNVLKNHGSLPTIKYRVKRFDAYFNKLIKLSRQNRESDIPAITDFLALRIICPFLEDLETIENLIKTNFNVIELDRKGSRYSIGEFGYDSVHFLIKIDPASRKNAIPYTSDVCEVQLRTILQDAWAEVEHELIYKSDITLPIESIRRKLAAINATLTLSDLIFQEIRDYQKEIRERDHKRRQSLEVKLASAPNIDKELDVSQEMGKSPMIMSEIDSIIGEANLEKALLAALEFHSGGQLENAVKIYTSILRLKIKDSVRSLVYNHRGMAYFGLSDYLRAIHDFSKSINYDSENIRCYNNRALTFRILKRYERSLEDYDRSITINPCQIDGFWGRAQTLCEMKLYGQALSDCEKALSIQNDFTPAQSLIKRINKLIF